MKTIVNINKSAAADIGLLFARVGITALMLTHGIPKLLMLLSGSTVQFPSVFGMSPEVSLALAVFAEVGCSLLLLLGLATRLVTIPLIITMLVAALLIHAPAPFSEKELAINYLLVYIFLFLSGGGKYSIDGLLRRKDVTARDLRISDPLAVYQYEDKRNIV